MERWLQIQEFPRYSISDQGRVRNNFTDRIMILTINGSGVVSVYLRAENGRQYNRGVAKLVADHFLPHNTNDLFDTPMHRDGDRTNNAVENLIWRPRWYAFKYHQQFDRYRRPYVDCPIIETQTGTVFANSWEATVRLGILETDIAHSFHAYQGRGETIPAHPTIYCFRRFD